MCVCFPRLNETVGSVWPVLCYSPTSEHRWHTGNNFKIIMAPPPAKRPRKVLSLKTKREILCRCDEGWSNARIMENFGIPKSSLCELKKAREKISAYTNEFSAATKTGKKKDRKTMAKPKYVDIDQCVIKWYQQQRGSGVMVRGTELKMAAERFAGNIGLQGFKATEGWLYRFKLRHGLTGKKVYGERLDANEEAVDQHKGGEIRITEENIVEWLESYAHDQGYHHQSEMEIASSVTEEDAESASDSEDEEETPAKMKLSDLRFHLDKTMEGLMENDGFKQYYSLLRDFRSDMIKRLLASQKKKTISDFFKPRAVQESARVHLPSTSSESRVPQLALNPTQRPSLCLDNSRLQITVTMPKRKRSTEMRAAAQRKRLEASEAPTPAPQPLQRPEDQLVNVTHISSAALNTWSSSEGTDEETDIPDPLFIEMPPPEAGPLDSSDLKVEIKEEPLPSPVSNTVDEDHNDVGILRSRVSPTHTDHNSRKCLTNSKLSKKGEAHSSENGQEMLATDCPLISEVKDLKKMLSAHHTEMEKYMEAISAHHTKMEKFMETISASLGVQTSKS